MRTTRFIITLAFGALALLVIQSKCYAQDTLVASYIGGSAGAMASSEYQASYSLGLPAATDEMSSEVYRASSGFTALASLLANTITVNPSTLPAGTLSEAYNQTLTASGGSGPYSFAITSGSLPPGLSLPSTGNLSGTPTALGNYDFTVTATDGNGFTGSQDYTLIIIPKGNIVGSITVSGGGLGGVTVKLLDANGFPATGINPATTNAQGEYSFTNLPPGDYQVMIVEPLGYAADQNPKSTSLAPGATNTVDFTLSQTVVSNSARSMGYWKHQFDVYLTGRGSAQENQTQLSDYVVLVHSHYTPHFSVFAVETTFADWQGVLTANRTTTMLDRAKQQLAALVLNFASRKIGQYTVVTADHRTAGDLLTYASALIVDGNSTNDELAKDLAEKVNTQQSIGAGMVPSGSILYKGGGLGHIDWSFNMPTEYALYSNYPNPFNPSTVIKYDLPVASFVSLKVYNIRAQEVAVLVNEELSAGRYSIEWNAMGMASGVYLYRFQAGDFVETKKLILLR